MRSILILFLIPVSSLGFLLLTGCLDRAESQEGAPAGFALLYSVTSQQQDVNKLLWIKDPGEQIDAWIREIASFNGEVTKQLEEWKSSGALVNLSNTGLPAAERKARELAARHTTEELLLGTGTDLRLDLMVAQLKALAYCGDMCAAVADMPEGQAMKDTLEAWSSKFMELNAHGMQLLGVKDGSVKEEEVKHVIEHGPPTRH